MVRLISAVLTFMSLGSLSASSVEFTRPDYPVIIYQFGQEYIEKEPEAVYGYVVLYGRFSDIGRAIDTAGRAGGKVVRYNDLFYVVSPVFFSEKEALEKMALTGGLEVKKVRVDLEVAE